MLVNLGDCNFETGNQLHKYFIVRYLSTFVLKRKGCLHVYHRVNHNICLPPEREAKWDLAESMEPCPRQERVACLYSHFLKWDFTGGASGKESACQCRRLKRRRFSPWVGKIPWRRKWQPTPVFLPEESHGKRSLVAYSPWGHKESDTTELVSTFLSWSNCTS